MTKRSIIYCVTILLFPIFVFSQEAEKEQEIIAPIQEVRIHLQGAEIVRTIRTTLSKGRHELVFTGLSPKINPASIQVAAVEEGVNILSTTNRINFLKEPKKKNPQVKRLQDSLLLLEDEIELISIQERVIGKEQKILENNQILFAKDKSVDLPKLKSVSSYYKERFLEIFQALSKLNKERKTINLRKTNIQKQLQELNVVKKPSSEIYLAVNTEQTQSIEFRVRYIVRDAGWSPVYDLVVSDLDKPITIKYRALAFNDTSVDWDDIKVTLSTADINQSATLPILLPWYIMQNIPQVATVYGQGRLNAIIQNQNNYNYKNEISKKKEVPSGGFVFEEIEISELSSDFEIAEKYSIPANRKPYSIKISETEKKASYQHYSVPKMDKDAFLLGQVVDWEDMDLMPGPMNIYYEKNFIGMAHLNIRNLSDTLDLSLGRDPKVLVKRIKLKELTKKQFLQSKKKLDLAYKITVKNNRNQPIEMELLDQIPISKLKEITVDVKEISKAQYFENTGKLKWDLKLQPGESRTCLLYTSPSPRDATLSRMPSSA